MSNSLGISQITPTRPHSGDCSDRVVFILPRLPPAHCGLGDYSMILLGHMRMDPPPRILVMHGAAETRAVYPELDVEQLPATQAGLLAHLHKLRAKRVFVQYVAQGFQSRGCPLWFLGALRKWRLETSNARLVMMLQELWFEPSFWKPDWLLQKFHRRALRRLASAVDRLFVSTESFYQRMKGATALGRLQVLINPATIPVIESCSQTQRQQGLIVLFGRQGSRIRALKDFAPWLGKLYSKGLLTRLLLLGSRETSEMNRKEDFLAATLLPMEVIDVLGPLSRERLSRYFLSAEMGICTKANQNFSKSTIFMGYASHGLSIISTNTDRNAEAPLSFVTHPADLIKGTVSARQLKVKGENLRDWYNHHADWPNIVHEYRKALEVSQ